MIDIVNCLDALNHTKICLSSRPLHEFKTAFAAKSGLRLQELNFESIFRYTKYGLLSVLKAQSFYHEHDKKRISGLTWQIARKSEGVFLWAVIAVRDLSQGLSDLANLEDLEMQVDQLPQGIKNLYTQMIQRIKPAYRRNAMKDLWSVMTALEGRFARTLTLAKLYFIDNENVTEDAPLVPSNVTKPELIRICQNLETRVLSHTLGLLEIPPYSKEGAPDLVCDAQVVISHSTVADFLRSGQFLKSVMSDEGLREEHLHRSFARGLLLDLIHFSNKILKESRKFEDPGWRRANYSFRTVQECLLPAMEQISIVERISQAPQTRLMTSLCSYVDDDIEYKKALSVLLDCLGRGFFRGKDLILPLDLIGLAACCSMPYYVLKGIGKPVLQSPSCDKCQGNFRRDAAQMDHSERVFFWDMTQDNEQLGQYSRPWLNKRLKWEGSLLQVHSNTDNVADILPETYLLLCCTMNPRYPTSSWPASTFVLMVSLLCAGADPMLPMRCIDLEGAELSWPIESRHLLFQRKSSFWEIWLLRELGNRLDLRYMMSKDPHLITARLQYVKALLAHGAMLEQPIRGQNWQLFTYSDFLHSTSFEFQMSAVSILDIIFKDYSEWEAFLTDTKLRNTKLSLRKQDRSILYILPSRQLSEVRGDTKVYLDEQEAETLWHLFDMYDHTGDSGILESLS